MICFEDVNAGCARKSDKTMCKMNSNIFNKCSRESLGLKLVMKAG